MKHSEFSRMLRHMEHIGELMLEAESPRHKRELDAEYAAMSATVRPYCTGEKQLEEDTDPEAAERERAAWAAAR